MHLTLPNGNFTLVSVVLNPCYGRSRVWAMKAEGHEGPEDHEDHEGHEEARRTDDAVRL
jgi:hypothetical protein